MTATTDLLSWSSLTGMANQIKSPNRFLQRFLFPRTQFLATETFEMSIVTRGRECAPLVRKNGEALNVGGHTQTFQTVTCPNIRIKEPFTPSDLFYERRAGTPIFASPGQIQNAIREHIMTDIQGMADMVSNTLEWLCAQTLIGTINYQVDDQENFTVTYPKPSANTITPSVFWDAGTGETPLADIHGIKALASEGYSGNITDGICGSEATEAIVALAEAGSIPALQTNSGITAGDLTLAEQYNDDGVMYLGRLGGIRLWSYQRTATLDNSTVNMIRPKYIEFVNRNNGPSGSDRLIVYGLIHDMQVLRGRGFVGKSLMKSWEEEDPSVLMALLTSRPLPVARKADAVWSFKAVSG